MNCYEGYPGVLTTLYEATNLIRDLGYVNTGIQEIGYISPEIPEVKFPPLEGEWQEGLVPDTLDLAERARFSINSLTESADPEAGYEIWWHVLLNRKPPVLVHDFHDLNVDGRGPEANLPR